MMPDARERFTRHRGPVTSVAPIPGTSQVLTAGYDGAVARCDLETGAFQLLGYHEHLANEVVVDPAGRVAASVSSDYTIALWDLATGARRQTLRGHADDVDTFLFLPGDEAVSGSHDRRILRWDVATGAIRTVYEGHEGRVTSLACVGDTLYSTGHDHTLRAWDLHTGRLRRTIGPFEHRTDTCSLDLRARRLALGCDDGVIRLFSLEDGALLHAWSAHASGIKRVTFSAATGRLLSAAYDQRILVYSLSADGRSHTLEATLEPHPAKWERSFAFSTAGDRVLAGTFDGTVLVWDAASGRLLRELGDDGGPRGNACFNRIAGGEDGRVALAADDGRIRTALLEAPARFEGERQPLERPTLMNAIARVGERGVSAGTHDGRLLVLPAGLDGPCRVTPLGEGPINGIAAGGAVAGGDLFVACYSGAVVRVDAEGAVVGRYRLHGSAVKAVRLHPTRPWATSCDAERGMLAWTLEGEVLVRFIGHTALINDADLSPDGARLVSVGRDFSVKSWSVETGHLLACVPLGKRSLKSVCHATDTLAVVGDYWGSVHAVELDTGRVTSRVLARNGISSLSRCGPHVAACSYDGSVVLLDPRTLETHTRLSALEQRVQ